MRIVKLFIVALSFLLLCGCQSTHQEPLNDEKEISSESVLPLEDDSQRLSHLPDEGNLSGESVALPENSISDKTDEYGVGIGYITDKSRFPLYAMIKEEDIYLYGINGAYYGKGMVLFIDGQGTYFDWGAVTYKALPVLSYFDYDSDGEKELAVLLYVDSGTGISKTDLHMLKILRDKNDHITYTEYSLLSNRNASGNSLDNWFTKKITAHYSEDCTKVIMNYDGTEYAFEVGYDTLGSLYGVAYGNIVKIRFTEDNEIIVSIEIGLKVERFADRYYVSTVEAKVVFDGNELYLSDYSFIQDPHLYFVSR